VRKRAAQCAREFYYTARNDNERCTNPLSRAFFVLSARSGYQFDSFAAKKEPDAANAKFNAPLHPVIAAARTGRQDRIPSPGNH
jgi:hypothetical protein